MKQATSQTTIDFSGVVPFRIGEVGSYDGIIDEIFYVDGALTDASIHRIFACGIDGARCTCMTTDPTQYETCGLAATCDTLTPCNAPAPSYD